MPVGNEAVSKNEQVQRNVAPSDDFNDLKSTWFVHAKRFINGLRQSANPVRLSAKTVSKTSPVEPSEGKKQPTAAETSSTKEL